VRYGEVSFGRIGDAADKATTSIRRSAKAIKTEGNRLQALADSFKDPIVDEDTFGGGGGRGVRYRESEESTREIH
jgi:hypothetical protein